MSDIALIWDTGTMEADINFDSDANDLDMDEGWLTAIIISLFTDRLANDDDPLPDPANTSRRGWWADQLSDIDGAKGDKIGSRLWLLSRSKTTEQTLRFAEEYAREALKWMIDEGAAVKVDAKAYRNGDRLELEVKVYKRNGDIETFKFADIWEGTRNATY